jgi:hypothetical protein
MYRLIIEHIIRRILQEEEYVPLQKTSFAYRDTRTERFINKLQKGTPIDLTNGQAVVIPRIDVDGKVYVKDPSKINDPDVKAEPFSALAEVLPKLTAKSKITFYDSLDTQEASRYDIKAFAKTKELGGKGKGAQRGTEQEDQQETTIKGALVNGPIDLIIVDVNNEEHILKGVSDFIPVMGAKKADFKFITVNGDVYVQTKGESHQQLEGVVRSNFAKNEQGRELIKELGRKTKEAIQDGRLKKPVVVDIPKGDLQTLAVYGGAGDSVPVNPSAVTMYFIGDIKVENNRLTARKIYYYPYVPENDPPVLAAFYKSARNQRNPENVKERLENVRLGVYFQSSLPSTK